MRKTSVTLAHLQSQVASLDFRHVQALGELEDVLLQ